MAEQSNDQVAVPSEQPANPLSRRLFLAGMTATAALGATAARVGGAPMLTGTARVTVWGVLAMAATAAVGKLFGTGSF